MIEMIKIDLDKKNNKTMKSKIKNLNNTQMNSQNLYSHCQRHLPHMINSLQFSPLFENARPIYDYAGYGVFPKKLWIFVRKGKMEFSFLADMIHCWKEKKNWRKTFPFAKRDDK